MANFLSKLFKPKWQNKSAEVRLEALQQLDPHNNEQREIIESLLLNDENPSVRQAALSKTSDPARVIVLYAKLNNADKPAAVEHLTKLSESLGLSLFDLIEDKTFLAQIIIATESPDEFLNSLARIQDEEALILIAQQAKLSRLRQAATELIESEECLDKVIETARSKDKKVFQIAKSKLSHIREHKKQVEQQKLQLSGLLANLKELANTDDTNLYSAKLDSLKQRCNALIEVASNDQVSSYQSLVIDCEKRLQAIQVEEAKIASVSAETKQPEDQESPSSDISLEQQDSELIATINTLEDTLSQLSERAAAPQDTSAIDAIIKTQETRWIESAKEEAVDKETEKSYKQKMSALRQYLSALQKLSQQQARIESLTQQSSYEAYKELKSILDKVSWPDNFALPALLITASEVMAKSEEHEQAKEQEQSKIEAELNQSLTALDKLLDEKQLNASKQKIQQVRKLHKKLTKKRQNHYTSALKLRSDQLNELRDWQGFAASPEQERLCESMEALIDKHIDPQEKSAQIKQLQERWKSLGGAQDPALWQRFSNAAEAAFAPCAEYYSEQGELKKANLEKRKKLAAELAEFVEQINWETVDWKAVEKINRQARNEWREAHPVDRRHGRGLQEQFNQTLAKLNDKIDAERGQNLAIKQDIVSRAQAFAESEELSTAMQGAKDLQSEWQKVGITEHKKDRVLWKEFRAACDKIFAQRDAQRNKAKQEHDEKLAQIEEIVNEAEQTVKQTFSSVKDAETSLASLRSNLKQVTNVNGKKRTELLDRYNACIEALKHQIKQLDFERILAQWNEAQRKADILAIAAENKEEIDANFASTVELSKRLEERFQARVKASKAQKLTISDDDLAQELCIRCEIAAGLESPASAQERRMQLQVTRLSEGLSGAASLSREEQLEQLLIAWFAENVFDTKTREIYTNRIDACIKQVFGAAQLASQKLASETAEPA